MTTGKIFPVLLKFALPLMLGSLFQNLYHLADLSIAGYTLGDHALAAISATGALATLINATAMGFNMGNSIRIAQEFGAGNLKLARKAFAGVIELCIAMAVIFTALLLALITPLLKLVQTPDELFQDAKAYIVVIIIGLIASMMYNMFAGAFRALGNSLTPLIFLIISSLLNIGLDLLFIAVFGMGVVGAAVATVLSQAISAVASGIYLHANYPEMRLKKEDFRGNGSLIKDMIPMGLSVALSNSLFAIGDIAIQGAVNSLGSDIIISHASASRIKSFAIIPSINMANACSTFAAQNYGAGKYDRITRGLYSAVIFNVFVNIVTTAIAYLFGGELIALVTNTESAQVIANGSMMLRIVIPFMWTQTIITGYRMTLQSMGQKVTPVIGTGIELVCRFVCAFGLAPVFGFKGICFAEPASWVTSGALMVICYYVLLRKLKNGRSDRAVFRKP